MYVLLGASGYVGTAFQAELARRGVPFQAASRSQVDYTRYRPLVEWLRSTRPRFLINCAGFTGKPNVDACESQKAETLLGNVALAQTIAHACEATGTRWGHVSSGCIYTGGKVRMAGEWREVPDLMSADVQPVWQNDPTALRGFSESDPPNFSFRRPPCSFYSGTKALGEEILADYPVLVWRLRIPFNGVVTPRNYLVKMLTYAKLLDAANSFSHLEDFVGACLNLEAVSAPCGIYNVTNPGWVTTRQVVERLKRFFPNRSFEFFSDADQFYRQAAVTPRSNTVLETDKLRSAGVYMRAVEEALDVAMGELAERYPG